MWPWPFFLTGTLWRVEPLRQWRLLLFKVSCHPFTPYFHLWHWQVDLLSSGASYTVQRAHLCKIHRESWRRPQTWLSRRTHRLNVYLVIARYALITASFAAQCSSPRWFSLHSSFSRRVTFQMSSCVVLSVFPDVHGCHSIAATYSLSDLVSHAIAAGCLSSKACPIFEFS